MGLRDIPFVSKEQLSVYYINQLLRARYIPDLIAFAEIVVELKAVKALLPEHEAQLLNYMRITKSAVGYLINFCHPSAVEWKRFILSQNIPATRTALTNGSIKRESTPFSG